ncbi:RVT-2 multi-domain protein [Pyrenophora tritici-repentis]|uniref:RVT-2 multi-domain protein n=1 Tax=Pyrenophora tritici-repentis TaxID=45151 RepID=A0A922SV23_9PLEO|nr:RVT-2 multi-domain protein [Pyrenophora tritici-repentis]
MAVEKEEWKIPQLTAENHDTWFRRNKVKLKGKKVFYVCEKNLVQHCQIAIAGELTEAMEELEIAEADKHTKIRVNIEKRDKYLEDEATAIDLLFRSLTEDDQALIDEYDTAFQFWAYLQKKYTQTDATTANIYMTRIQTFTFNPGNTIVGSWEKLKEYRRKLVAADADTNGAYKDSALLLVLIRSLPKEFKTTIDTLNAQLNLTVEQKLKFLEEKEVRDQQDADEKALPAFRKTEKYVPPYKRRNHKSSPLSSDSESGTKFMVQCFLCDGAHGVRDCPRRERARKLLKEYDAKKSSKPPIKTLKQRNSHKKTGKAYGAEEVNSESDELSETSDSEPEEIETCRLSKDIVVKRHRGRPRRLTTIPPTAPSDERVPNLVNEEGPEEPCTQSVREKEIPRYFTRQAKRKRSNEEIVEDERFSKIVKAMLAQVGLTEEQTRLSEKAFAATEIAGIQIPQTHEQAINDPKYGKQWKAAILEEIIALIENRTWEEVPKPKDANMVDSKWVFTVKTNLDGTVERFKARLVARGFTQAHGTDYNETFAPTVRMDTLRLFMATVAAENLECFHFDIKNAFTESHLKEEIFLKQPQGVEVKKGYVLRVLRSLYGLKQAARQTPQQSID